MTIVGNGPSSAVPDGDPALASGTGLWGDSVVDALGGTGKSIFRHREQWLSCDRCGFVYPLSLLKIQQGDSGNFAVCVISCYDQPSRGDLYIAAELPREVPFSYVDEGGPTSV